MSYYRWEVYLAKVLYEDMAQYKIRPVVVIEDLGCFVLSLKMTGQPPRKGEYVLKEWAYAGLKKETTVRLSKKLKLHPNDMIKRLGALHTADIVEIQKRIQI